MLLAYYLLVVLCVDNIELIVQNLLFAWFIPELSAKETLERLGEGQHSRRRLMIGTSDAYLPLTEILIR